MSRLPPKYLDTHSQDHLTAGDVRFREEPDEEEDKEEKEDEGDSEEGDDDDDQNGGYSLRARSH